MPSQLAFTGPDQTPLNLFIIPTETLVKGDTHSGEYTVEIQLPQWATADGVYLLEYLLLCDAGGNEAVYHRDELKGAGFA